MRSAARGFFVTGTDTGVGKTLIACALLRAFSMRSLRAAGMKPVATGARVENGVLRNDDVSQLTAAANVESRADLVNPYCFEPPIAPHIAARQAGVAIALDKIADAYRELARSADVVVVEGAGGLRVPLSDAEDIGDLVVRLGLPVVLVVGMRLGCLNHALLTVEAIARRGLRLAGWIANCIDPAMSHISDNVAALDQRIRAPRLAHVPFMPAPDAADIASILDADALFRAA
jgi:dethiobiotin synthetase